ncbi:MAG: glycosyltransferase [Chloroflexi bacterium]|nr:glycosyltransferase [Chloroflexota bacterium]
MNLNATYRTKRRYKQTELMPDMSARSQVSRGQLIFLGATIALLILGLLLGISLLAYFTAFVAVASLIYIATMSFDIFLSASSLRNPMHEITPKQLRQLNYDDLPSYSVLIALYKEADIVESLVNNLTKIVYPRRKLEIMLLLEEDDDETINRVNEIELPPYIHVVLVPESQPRTKPKALNVGLQQARGQLCVVYDAEDFPDPYQLMKAAYIFSQSGPEVVCLQAKLIYHNAETNLLTRFFAAEYSKFFHLTIPGLGKHKLLIPLGGTSNHFKTNVLRRIGAWDPYNVTEDCDLGVRIARLGYRVESFHSLTLEAANSVPLSWIKQRSRWIKGYMQTYLVHMRNPVRLFQDLGWRKFLSFQLTIFGTPITMLMNPIFWTLTLLYILTRASFIEVAYTPIVMAVGIITMIFGNFVFIFFMLTGAMLQREHSSVKWMLLSPIYWAMMSIAAWKALYQLIFKPHYWEKTQHKHVELGNGAATEAMWEFNAPSATVEARPAEHQKTA